MLYLSKAVEYVKMRYRLVCVVSRLLLSECCELRERLCEDDVLLFLSASRSEYVSRSNDTLSLD